MPNLSIPQLSAGDPAIASDLIPISRSNSNYSLMASSIANANALKTITVPISSAEILNLNFPVELVAPQVGHAYLPIVAALSYDAGSSAYIDPSVGNIPIGIRLAAVTPSGGNAVYSFFSSSIPPAGGDALVGTKMVVSGYQNSSNNGNFTVVASTTTSVTLANSNAVAETPSNFYQLCAGVIVLNITSVNTSVAGSATYHATYVPTAFFTASQPVVISGFIGSNNNGRFTISSSTSNTVVVNNASATSETASAQMVLVQTGSGSSLIVTDGTQNGGSLGFFLISGGSQNQLIVTNLGLSNLIAYAQSNSFSWNGPTSGRGLYLALFASFGLSPTSGNGTMKVTLTYLDVQV